MSTKTKKFYKAIKIILIILLFPLLLLSFVFINDGDLILMIRDMFKKPEYTDGDIKKMTR